MLIRHPDIPPKGMPLGIRPSRQVDALQLDGKTSADWTGSQSDHAGRYHLS